jgi:hypothetical protein
MKVVEVVFVEECLDGMALRDLRLDQPVDDTLVRRFAELGEIDYYEHFPIPCFRGDVGVIGTVGSSSFRIVLPSLDRDAAFRSIREVPDSR